ncbi:MAG TPA: hypothetical protein VHB02_18305 [Acidimicrobiales bacterium]|nr:hypothetical protein [Acidimicrobiales bacterium]
MNLECVVNVSEGRDVAVLGELAAACGGVLLDVHRDPDHHRAVFTLGGPAATVEAGARALAAAAVAAVDLAGHAGRHPRIGVLDVVPFVPLDTGPVPDLAPAVAARDRFARWAAAELELPCFLYGPLPDGGHRTLPELRRAAFGELRPDYGPPDPHPTAGGCAVGARPVLVAYNLWVAGGTPGLIRSVASAIRGPAVRSLGLDLSGKLQVSCNLVAPYDVGPAQVHDTVDRLLRAEGARVAGSELVGLVPEAVLAAVPPARWAELDLRPDRTIEARLESRLTRPG